jgi:7-cyano-7-deazaguanine synthase in queuosine biosynthesis
VAATELAVVDGLVLPVLFHCMQQNRPVRIHGNLSETGIRNLHEIQRAWACWKPGRYHQVDLTPDAVVAATPQSKQVIQAFSGGVDATFSLISNKFLHKNRGGFNIAAGLLVHGFDVPYTDMRGFESLSNRARAALDHAGVELKIIRTNSRSLNIQSWMDSNTAQLAACLHQFAQNYGRALIGSAEPYDVSSLGVGANPITDPLLSGDLMSIVHDGAGYSRTEKIAAIAEFPFYVDRLHVCWEGDDPSKNCGRCTKCLRTRLNFAAIGLNDPSCFQGSFNKRLLRKLRPSKSIDVVELEGVLTYLRRRHLSYPWASALRRRILLARLAIPIKKTVRWNGLRELARALLRALRSWNVKSTKP